MIELHHLKPIIQTGQSRIALARFYLDNRNVKLSISICWKPQDFWIGAFWERGRESTKVYICLLPMVPIRFHWKRSYGGKFG